MAGHVDRSELPGIVTLFSRRGDVHVEAIGIKAFGGSDPIRRDSIFRIASMTQPITAVAATLLVEECELQLDDPVDQWLPELANRKVLKSIRKAMEASGGGAPGPDLPSHPPYQLMKRFGALPLVHQPGERWLYHSGSDILGVLITRVSAGRSARFCVSES
jgi:CubicO group peptidase (beta-lactamase class C family)